VPLIIAGPGIPKDRLSEALIYLYDLFPTLASLSGLPLPGNIDGLDHSPVLKGEKSTLRTSLFTAYRHTIRAVRTDEWKLIRYPERNFTQLFNLREDPFELNNLAGKPEKASKVKELTGLLENWQKQSGDTAKLTTAQILPLEYDRSNLIQKPDVHQPDYILKKYFGQ